MRFPHDTTLAIVSFHSLCHVLDLLQQDKKLGNVDPETLHGAVERHVTFRIAAYGEDRQQPKVHWSLHLSSMKRLQPVLNVLGPRKETPKRSNASLMMSQMQTELSDLRSPCSPLCC